MKKVIVTGADGFIGSNLIKTMRLENIEVWAIVHADSTTKDCIRGLSHVHCVECDIGNLSSRFAEFPEEADAFYHFAWQGVDALERNDLEIQLKNIDICIDALKFASQVRAKKFILPGSTSEYLYYGKPINECAVPSPINAYGSVKVALRYLAKQYAQQLDIDFIYVVITGIYAADRRDNNVIFYVIDQLLKGEKPSLTKLDQLWDYVSIDDVVEALIRVGEKGRKDAFYAIGHGDNWPLRKYIEIIHDYINPELPLGIGEIPYVNDVLTSSCIDLTALKNDTGFTPKINFEDGIKKVIAALKEEKYFE